MAIFLVVGLAEGSLPYQSLLSSHNGHVHGFCLRGRPESVCLPLGWSFTSSGWSFIIGYTNTHIKENLD